MHRVDSWCSCSPASKSSFDSPFLSWDLVNLIRPPSQVEPACGFRGGLVFKAHGLLYHSTLGSKVVKKKKFGVDPWCSCSPARKFSWDSPEGTDRLYAPQIESHILKIDSHFTQIDSHGFGQNIVNLTRPPNQVE